MTLLRSQRLDQAPGKVFLAGEHAQRYEEFASFLAGAGFHVYVPDLRGYGRSSARRSASRVYLTNVFATRRERRI